MYSLLSKFIILLNFVSRVEPAWIAPREETQVGFLYIYICWLSVGSLSDIIDCDVELR